MFEHEQSRTNLKINSPSRLRPGGVFKPNSSSSSIRNPNPPPPSPHHVLKILKVLPVNSDLDSLLNPSGVLPNPKDRTKFSSTFSPSRRAKPTQVLTICLEEEQKEELISSGSNVNSQIDRETSNVNLEQSSMESDPNSFPSSSSTSLGNPSIFKGPIFVLFSSSSSPTDKNGSKTALMNLDKILGWNHPINNQRLEMDPNQSTTSKVAELRIGVYDPLEMEINVNSVIDSLLKSLENKGEGEELERDSVVCLLCSKFILL